MDVIGSLQIRIMRCLWAESPSTIHTLHDSLNSEYGVPELAYTTVLTVARNLVRRDMVSQEKTGRSHAFAPLVTELDYQKTIVSTLCDEFFDGDADKLIKALVKA